MNDGERIPPWYAPWRRFERAPAEMDPADLGTAFGLDLSLAVADEPAPAGERRAGRHWLERSLRRR